MSHSQRAASRLAVGQKVTPLSVSLALDGTMAPVTASSSPDHLSHHRSSVSGDFPLSSESSRDGSPLGIVSSASNRARRRWIERFVVDFLTIEESSWRRSKGKVFGVPFDFKQRGFAHLEKEESFPFEAIGQEDLKIKSVPISFHWASNGERRVESLEMGGRR